eukprot:SAG11_NODE_1418_length_4962_cov_3.782644_5_plen_90_part_00
MHPQTMRHVNSAGQISYGVDRVVGAAGHTAATAAGRQRLARLAMLAFNVSLESPPTFSKRLGLALLILRLLGLDVDLLEGLNRVRGHVR